MSAIGPAPSLIEAATRRPAARALHALVRAWHGIDLDEHRWTPDLPVPPELARLLPHQTVLCRQHHLVLPEPDTEDPDRWVFCVDNQGRARWAYDADDGTDPCVAWQADENEEWLDEALRLDDFLLTLVLTEATIGGSYRNGGYTSTLAPATLAAALAPLTPVGLPWRLKATQCYAGAEVLAFTTAAVSGAGTLWIAGQSSAALHYLNAVIQADPLPWLEIRVDGRERYPIDGF